MAPVSFSVDVMDGECGVMSASGAFEEECGCRGGRRRDVVAGSMEAPFNEQVAALTTLFERWGACERTVALVALLRKAPWPALRLLQEAAARALDHALASDVDKQTRDAEANDARVVAHSALALGEEGDGADAGERLRILVRHLPLLRPGNEEAKRAYLRAVPHLVKHCVRHHRHVDQCQEMLSYLLIHPAVTDADKRSLTQWLSYLENHIMNINNAFSEIWSQKPDSLQSNAAWPTENSHAFRRTIGKNVEFKTTVDEVTSNGSETHSLHGGDDNLQESFSKNGTETDLSTEIERSFFDPGVIQPKARRSNSLTPPSTSYGSSSENLNVEHFMQKPRSFSLSSEHSLLNVQAASNLSSSSGSETKLDEMRYSNRGDHDGMSTIAHWLKSLRLHKYIWLFANISYDQMMAIDEEYLQRLGVTKGARHKLLLSIKKLSERQGILEEMEKELSNGGYMSITSMTSLLEQLRSIVISPIKPESPLASLVVRVLDLASSRLLSSGSSYHDGGTAVSLHCWLVDRALAHDAFSRSAALAAELKSLKYRVPPRQFLAHLGDATFQRRPKPRWRNCINSNNWQSTDSSRKSSSYPSFPPAPPLPKRLPSAASMGDINSRLESLCLQMTEQAIN